jgi:hypothetical protein
MNIVQRVSHESGSDFTACTFVIRAGKKDRMITTGKRKKTEKFRWENILFLSCLTMLFVEKNYRVQRYDGNK